MTKQEFAKGQTPHRVPGVACIAGMLLAVSGAMAQAPVSTSFKSDIVDLDAVMKKGLELQKARLESQIQSERSKAGGPVMQNVSISPSAGAVGANTGSTVLGTDAKDMRVVGIYGVGEHLIAHLLINGTRVPVRIGSELEGWRVTGIDERSVHLHGRSSRSGRAAASSTTDTQAPSHAPAKGGSTVRLWLHTDRMPDSVLRDASSRPPTSMAAGTSAGGQPPIPMPLPPLPRTPGMVPAGTGVAR